MSTIGFISSDIDDLAAKLESALSVRLWRQMSPMIGTWYSDIDMSTLVESLRTGQPTAPVAERYQLVLNDPEPGRGPRDVDGPFGCILRVSGSAATGVAELLARSGLAFTPLTP